MSYSGQPGMVARRDDLCCPWSGDYQTRILGAQGRIRGRMQQELLPTSSDDCAGPLSPVQPLGRHARRRKRGRAPIGGSLESGYS